MFKKQLQAFRGFCAIADIHLRLDLNYQHLQSWGHFRGSFFNQQNISEDKTLF